MKKLLNLTNDQKNLIWQRFVQPKNGTKPELMQFIEMCETFGLNPLLGDIVFQRYQTKGGPRTSFITTRDGLLRVASRQPGYVGAPNANVVKEGDEFEFIPSEGGVKHRFGTKRGKILGAYAVMYHERFRPVSVFVDFDEHFRANAASMQQRGGNPVWDKHPSSMITKVAEVFVIRRQFPLGGLYTAEEMGIDDLSNIAPPVYEPQPNQEDKQQTSISASKPTDSKQEEKQQKLKSEQPSQENAPTEKQEKQPAHQESTHAEQTATTVIEKQEEEIPGDATKGKEYVLDKFESGTSPSGIPFAKLTVIDQETREKSLVLAKGQESLDLTQLIPDEQSFYMETKEENGFLFLETINGQSSF